jgi:hypothetical protein
MIADMINKVRADHGRPPFYQWNSAENAFCSEHSNWMARSGRFDHAPGYLLNGKREAIGECGFCESYDIAMSTLLRDMECSPKHLSVLLSPNIAYGFIVANYRGYLTIRGW